MNLIISAYYKNITKKDFELSDIQLNMVILKGTFQIWSPKLCLFE